MPFTDSNGKNYTLLSCTICPIGEHLYEDKWQLSGTGFYINPEGIALSAGHNFKSRDNSKVRKTENNEFEPIGTSAFFRLIPEPNNCVKIEIAQIQKVIILKKTDIAIVLAGIKKDHGDPPKRLNLSSKAPTIGEKIFCYSYANEAGNISNIEGKLALNSTEFEGEITNLFLSGRDRFLMPGPCIEAKMNAKGGTSGGPVFNNKGKVIGVISTNIDGTPPITYITPIYPILDVKFNINTDQGNKNLTPRDLSKLNIISLVE